MKKKILVVFVLIFLFISSVNSENYPMIVVLDFTSTNFVQQGSVDISELLISELGRFNFRVMNSIQSKKISKEFLYGSQSDSIDLGTAIRIGRVSGADFVVTGTINPFRSVYQADVSVINVRTGQLKFRIKMMDKYFQPLSISLASRIAKSFNLDGQEEKQSLKERKQEANQALTQHKNARLMAQKNQGLTDREAREQRKKLHKTAPVLQNDAFEESPTPEIKKVKDSTPPNIIITSPDVSRSIKIVANEAHIKVTGKASDSSGVALVTVNEQEASLDENGNFSADILLKVGENQIAVTSMDIYRNQDTQRFTIKRKSIVNTKEANTIEQTVPISDKKGAGHYFALVIGNNNYKYLSKLNTALNDARTIEKMLKESYGFETKLIEDAKREDILDAMNDYRYKLSLNDNFLIYYAGHGEFEKESNKAYWLPVDAKRDNPSQWIIADDITSHINRYQANHVLIVSDSCYSGTLDRAVETDLGKSGGREEYLKKMEQRKSRTLMASGGNEPVSDGGGKGHSIFADSFIKALTETELNSFTADEVFYKSIRSLVGGRSEQLPEYKEIRNSGHEGGDFVFMKKKKE